MIISPLSVSIALGLLSQGVDGNTYGQLKHLLHLSDDKSLVANQFLEYRETLEENTGKATISIANQIFVQDGYQLNKSFEEVAVSKFKSGVELLNFADSEKSVATINRFVEEKTNGKITNFFKPNSFSSGTQSVLVNAIHFKADWAFPFSVDFTSKLDFHNSETDKTQVDFMRGNWGLTYLNDLHATALELIYANSSVSFVMVMPDSGTDLAELEVKLKNNDLRKVTENLFRDSYEVYVPKFKVEYEIDLNEVLKNVSLYN